MKYILILLATMIIAGCGQSQTAYNYITHLPKAYNSEEFTPLIIFLHGAGERGNDIDKVKVHGPPKLAEQGKDIPAIIISPQCPNNEYWNVDRLEATLAEIKAKHKVDLNRIYLTGLSMGGYGTMSWAYAHPEHFAGLAPICGGELQAGKSEGIKNIPLWAFHGTDDSAVPIENTDEYIQALRDIGGQPKYTTYPGVGHDSWTQTYDDPAFWDWLFNQKKL